MRKDLNIGLAIGGVLLAVLIVWGVVVSGSRKHKEVTLQTVGGTATDIPPAAPTDTTPPPAPADTPAVVTPPPIVMPAPQPATDTPASAKKGDEWVGLLAGTTPAPLISAAEASKTIDPTPPIVTQSPDPSGPVASAVQPGSQQIPVAISPDALAPSAPDTSTPPTPAVALDAHPTQDTPASTGARTHTVARGETLSSISKAVYGDSRYYQKIADANPKINPNRLRPGTVINLPDAAEVKSSSSKRTTTDAKSAPAATSDAPRPTVAAVDAQKEYRVVSGDSLYRISTRLYGSGEEADTLYKLNKDKIGPDAAKLKVGMILQIPSPPTVATASR